MGLGLVTAGAGLVLLFVEPSSGFWLAYLGVVFGAAVYVGIRGRAYE